MKKLLKDNLIFLIPYILVLIFAIYVLLSNTKSEIHLNINSYHSDFFDQFFKYTTFLGDGIVLLIIAALLVLIKYKYSIVLAANWLISSLLFVVPMKQIAFKTEPRPVKFFEGSHNLHLIEGVDIHNFHSFPSGHTTTAFVLFFTLSIFTKNKILKVVFFILALIAAYSRMYLSQHFLIDVTFGSMIGVSTALIGSFYLLNLKNKNLEKALIKKS